MLTSFAVFAVFAVVAVAAVGSYERAYESSMVMLDQGTARGRSPLARWLIGLGIVATLARLRASGVLDRWDDHQARLGVLPPGGTALPTPMPAVG